MLLEKKALRKIEHKEIEDLLKAKQPTKLMYATPSKENATVSKS